MFPIGMKFNKRLSFVSAVFIVGMLAIWAVYSLKFNGPPIRSDGVGYYLYLPAIFIYRDISLHSMLPFFGGHIPSLTGATFYGDTSNYLIKYPMGEALLLMPFFFAACIFSSIFNITMDGFSLPFQSAAAVSGLFYMVLGLGVLWKFLQRNFNQNTILIVLSGILFGTNLFHYATYDSIFSHSYSFFLFCTFIFLATKFSRKEVLSSRSLIATGAVSGLIVLTRPTNGLWLLLGLFHGITSLQLLWERLYFWKTHLKACLLVLLPFLGLVSLQFLYWKVITGSFLVYSYPGETFNFLKPEIINVLFSVRKGLFFWSPVLLTVIPGLFYSRKKIPDLFIPLIIFFPLNLYVISSWYCWWYGGSFGNRAFVESMPAFAICLCSLYEGIKSSSGKRFLVGFICCCSILSVWMMIKYWTGAIPFDGTTVDILVRVFSWR
jgi:hypothetical protein